MSNIIVVRHSKDLKTSTSLYEQLVISKSVREKSTYYRMITSLDPLEHLDMMKVMVEQNTLL